MPSVSKTPSTTSGNDLIRAPSSTSVLENAWNVAEWPKTGHTKNKGSKSGNTQFCNSHRKRESHSPALSRVKCRQCLLPGVELGKGKETRFSIPNRESPTVQQRARTRRHPF